jgi:hypothetical protein
MRPYLTRFAYCLALLAPIALMPRAFAAIPASERQVLVNLYNSTHGGTWAGNANWCSGACPTSGVPAFNASGTECTWFGITCDAGQAHVIAIALSNNNLAGSLPALAALANLQYFAVVSNQLSGPIPALGSLTQLQTFYAARNFLSGSIPALSGLANLGDFAVQFNQLTGTIPSLSGLANLYSFNVANNSLGGSVPAVSNLTNLRDLDVSNNLLTGSLPTLSGSTGALRLSFESNHLTGSIPALPANLYSVHLGYNRIGGSVPVAPASLHPSVVFETSSLCPNALATTPTANDAGWDAATGFSPWWSTPFAGNRCDGLFNTAFDL